jgi:hypothetical protein
MLLALARFIDSAEERPTPLRGGKSENNKIKLSNDYIIQELRRMGKGAKRRAHHRAGVSSGFDGHASLCPSYDPENNKINQLRGSCKTLKSPLP